MISLTETAIVASNGVNIQFSSTQVNVSSNLNIDGNVLANNFASTGTGVPTLTSSTNINLTAAAAVVITNSVLRLRGFSTNEIANLSPLNGDIIYNSNTNQFQGYANNNWVSLNGNVV